MHTWRRKVDKSGSIRQYDNTAHYVQHRDQTQQWEKHLPFLNPLILRCWSRPWSRPWVGLGAWGWTFLPRLGSAVILLWGWRAGNRFGSTLLLPILHWGCWTTAGLLVTRDFFGSAARIPHWLYLWMTLWTGLGFPVSWTGPWFAGAWTRFGFTGSRAGPAIARTWFAFSWLGARLPSRSGTGMTSLVAMGTRPVRNKRKAYVLLHVLHDCANLTSNQLLTQDPIHSLTYLCQCFKQNSNLYLNLFFFFFKIWPILT